MKQKLLLKVMLLLCALVAGSSSVWADSETLVFNTDDGLTAIGITKPSSGSGTNLGNDTYVQGDVSLSATNGTTETRVWNKSGATTLRIYSTGTFTISVPSSKEITSIVFTGTTNITANVGTWTSGTKTWSGSSQSVTFTNESTQSQIETIEVTYGAADTRIIVDINSLTFSPNFVAVGGATATATAGHNTPACTTATFTYESLDTDKATCTSAGVITAVANGTARIKATMSIPNDDPNYRVGTATITQTIEVKKAFHTASFYVNGVVSSSDSFEEDATVTFPSDPAGLGGKDFVGWTKGPAIVGTTDDKPSFVITASEIMGNSDITYYAVFATSATGTLTKTDNLTRATTGVTSGSSTYSSWSGKTASSDAVYAGNSAGGNDAIQLRTTNSNSGVITTASGGKATKVVVTWQSDTQAGRTLNVYGKNTAYSAASDLYGDGAGTLIGTIVKGTSTELNINDDYEYIGVRSASGAMYLTSISIDWETTGTTYSAYCTSVTVPVTITSAGWASFSSASALDFTGTDVTAYIAKSNGGTNSVTLTEIKKVPANTGIVVNGSEATHNIPVLSGDADATTGNLLKPWLTEGEPGDATYYTLAVDGGNPIFKMSSGGILAAGKAYLVMPGGATAPELGVDFGNTTSIDAIQKQAENGEFYNLAGQRVAKPTKGLYIVNGKKVIIK